MVAIPDEAGPVHTFRRTAQTPVRERREKSMSHFQQSVEEMAEAILSLPPEELRRLERSLERLTSEQIHFACRAMRTAIIADRLPLAELRQLEHGIERWWVHSLPAKLVLIARIVELSERSDWPGDPLPECVIYSAA